MPGNLLNDPLIQKYFGCICEARHCENYVCPQDMSSRILDAMQAEIKPGERYLDRDSWGWKGVIWSGPDSCKIFHPYCLRLPDRYQKPEKKECECRCHVNSWYPTSWDLCCANEKPVDPVEEQIKAIENSVRWRSTQMLNYDLRHLVALVRQERK